MVTAWTDILGEHDLWVRVWGALMALIWIAIVVCAVWLALLNAQGKRRGSRWEDRADDRPGAPAERTSDDEREPELIR